MIQQTLQSPVVDLRNISKRFGGTVALNGVSLSLAKGEIVGLIGENGAGKSTLMNVVSGVVRPDDGVVEIDGATTARLTPSLAQSFGVQIVHQELSLLPDMTVAENIFLGKEIKGRFGNIKKTECEKRAQNLLNEFDIDIDAKQKVVFLSAAQKQLVEICKSLAAEMKVLILDEPTSSLTEKEMECLKRILPILKQKGVGVIFISHKLDEVKDLCDSIAVLRDGNMVGRHDIANVTINDMIGFMVGRDIHDEYQPSQFIGEKGLVLEVNDLSSEVFGEISLQNINLEVYTGEIVGMFGLIGSGRTETIKAIHGIRPIQKGTVSISSKKISRPTIKKLISSGVAWVTEDRRHEGVCLAMSIKNNIGLTIYRQISKLGFIQAKKLEQLVTKYSEQLSIKASNNNAWVETLSGGNQQKVVLSKWLAMQPKLLILDEPTRGIDIGSKSEIHQLIREQRDNGMAVLVISSEMPELLSLSDRIVVMKNGIVSGEISRKQERNISEQAIMELATLANK